jgi:ABC-type phosphate/phosphonate transport system permease subunit
MLAALIQWNYGADVLACMFLLVGTIIALDYLSAYWRHKLIGVNQ